MTDAELIAYLNLNEDEAKVIIPQLTPERRAVFEKMSEVEHLLNKGIVPPGVIVCRKTNHQSS